MKNSILLIAIFLAFTYAKCPEQSITEPCRCNMVGKFLKLTCDAYEIYNITEISVRISNNSAEVDKHYDQLDLKNLNKTIKSLEENSFYDLSFREIELHSFGLERIHENALYSSRFTLQQLHLSTNERLSNEEKTYNIFNLINSMEDLREFCIIASTRINEIPENKLNSTSLRSITNFKLQKLNNNAYKSIMNIENIEIDGSFDFIPSQAFVVQNHNKSVILKISLCSTEIESTSFESGVFTNADRTLHLKISGDNNLKYLGEHIFGPLFNNYPKSTVDLSDNSAFDCFHCNNKWLFEKKTKLKNKLNGAICEDGKSLNNMTLQYFNNNTNCHGYLVEYICIACGSCLTIIIIISMIQIIKWKIKSNERKNLIKILMQKNQIKERNALSLLELIGKGNFGLVYKALLTNESNIIEVAVKTVKNGCDKNVVESCFKEGIMLLDFNHERVLTPIAICFDINNYPMIILPLMMNGDLLIYLSRRDVLLNLRQLFKFTQHISEGMEYLSSHNFVHRDLAARNCLLDENLCAKIGDFGLSRDIYAKHYYRSKNKIPLPVKWMAPECIENGYYNTQTDIWSFGVLFWEILSRGSDPYPTIDSKNVLQYIKSGGRLTLPSYCPKVFCKIIYQCWAIEPEFRPNFPYISDFIRIIFEDNNLEILIPGIASSVDSYMIPPLHFC